MMTPDEQDALYSAPAEGAINYCKGCCGPGKADDDGVLRMYPGRLCGPCYLAKYGKTPPDSKIVLECFGPSNLGKSKLFKKQYADAYAETFLHYTKGKP